MLILKRKKNESILIGDDIRITVLECSSGGPSRNQRTKTPAHSPVRTFRNGAHQ